MSPVVEERIRQITGRFLEEGYFRGAVLRVERDGRLLYEGAWGHALWTETERIATGPSTLFDLASVSKLFTTTAILRLVTLGRFSLGDPVVALLRPSGGEAGLERALGNLDVASLLAHSSGILAWYPFYLRRGRPFEEVLADVLEANPPRRAVIYSDLNFMILGRIIEIATNLPLAAAMDTLVLEPLALDRTTYGAPAAMSAATELGNRIERSMVAERGLSFEGWRDESRPIRGEPNDGNCYYFFGGTAGHAGLFSDARDLCRLGSLYRQRGQVEGAPFLAHGLAEEAMRDHGGSRGLGFQGGEGYPGGGWGHTGFTGTWLYVSTDRDLVIALLTNRLHVPQPRDTSAYRREIVLALLAGI